MRSIGGEEAASRSDLLSAAMVAMMMAGRSHSPAEAAIHRADWARLLTEAHAAPWEQPRLRVVPILRAV